MSAGEDFIKSLITSNLKTHYDLDITALVRLALGADSDASVYQAQTKDQVSYFIKLRKGPFQDLFLSITELFQEAGIKQIVFPVKTKEGKITARIEDYTLIVYPFIDGQDGFHQALNKNQWIEFGKALRQVHEIKVPPSLIRQETYSPQWREQARRIWMHEKPLIDEIALSVQTLLKEKKQTILRLIDRADQLAKKIHTQSHSFVLCHSDIHAGNVLIGKDQSIYIVDWDAPILAPKERDLMFIGGGVGNVWNQPQEEAYFYQGYGKTKPDPTLLAYYRQERILEDIVLYSQDLLSTRTVTKERKEMYRQFLALFAPQGVLEIAFQTDALLN